MHNSEIIPALIARIRQNNTDNVVIRSKLYNLLNDVTRKFNEAMIACPHIVDFQNMSNEQVLEHYYLSVGAESLWELWIVLLVICVILLKINLILN